MVLKPVHRPGSLQQPSGYQWKSKLQSFMTSSVTLGNDREASVHALKRSPAETVG